MTFQSHVDNDGSDEGESNIDKDTQARTNSSDDEEDEDDDSNDLVSELEMLQSQLSLIEALEGRNRAQLDSFIDEQDQWDSLEEDERQLLSSKDSILQRIESITETLVQVWMGQKSMNG